jgi:hypothetical protein
MLPGLRFLFAAIILSMSILVFGLGAAALLRAAHEEFASNPSWHATPETMFTQQAEATRPVLAMLRIDTPAADQPTSDNAPVAAAPAEQVAATPTERIAALKPEDSPPPATVKPEIPVETAPAQSDAAPAPADAPASADETTMAPVLSSANETAPTAPEQATPEPASAPALSDTNIAPTKVATLGGPAVTIETPVTRAKPEKSVVKKRKHARRPVQRRRIASRAGVAGQPLQQLADPFAQPTGR